MAFKKINESADDRKARVYWKYEVQKKCENEVSWILEIRIPSSVHLQCVGAKLWRELLVINYLRNENSDVWRQNEHNWIIRCDQFQFLRKNFCWALERKQN